MTQRVAGAPVSWGICEVPGWGYQLDSETVLAQMSDIGLTATEFGPDGFLPAEPSEKAKVLSRYGLRGIGQFIPVVLNDPAVDPLPTIDAAMKGLAAAHANTVVLAAATGRSGYDDRPVLDESGWAALFANLDRIDAAASARGLVVALHPHIGTMIESANEIQRIIDGCSVGLCLDTGHILIGGGTPVDLAKRHPDRIVHCHLKDVRLEWAQKVQAGSVSYTDAVAKGMYAPLGQGDVDVSGIIRSLESAGYQGWYVLEQDTILTGPPAQTGSDPVHDIEASFSYVCGTAQR